MPDSHSRCIQIDICPCRSRVVCVPKIVDKTSVGVYQSSCQQFEVLCQTELIMEPVVPVHQPGECIVIVDTVMCIADIRLEEILYRHIPIKKFSHTDCFAGNTEVDSFVFLRRKISVEHIRKSDTVHRCTCYITVDLQTVCVCRLRL